MEKKNGKRYLKIESLNIRSEAILNKLLEPKVTPLIKIFDKINNNIIYLKDETKQYTGAFKYRGVYNKLKKVDLTKYKGVITSSTGNHGQAVSLVTKQIEIMCEVVLPYNTPKIKKEKIKANGAIITQDISLNSYDICTEYAKKKAQKNQLLYISSFDDLDIIEGHKTLFEETNIENYDYCFCPIGGGGLISAALKTYNLSNTKVIGVELDNNDSMKQSLMKNKRLIIALDKFNDLSFCEGILVKQIGKINYEIAKDNKLDVQTVSLDQIKKSIIKLDSLNIKTEGAGAAAFAAYLKSDIKNSKILCVVSGGNINDEIFNNIIKEKNL